MRNCLALCLALMLAGTASAATITVGASGDHATIQAAINAATAGDTIELAGEVFLEELEIDKQLTIQAAVGAIPWIVRPEEGLTAGKSMIVFTAGSGGSQLGSDAGGTIHIDCRVNSNDRPQSVLEFQGLAEGSDLTFENLAIFNTGPGVLNNVGSTGGFAPVQLLKQTRFNPNLVEADRATTLGTVAFRRVNYDANRDQEIPVYAGNASKSGGITFSNPGAYIFEECNWYNINWVAVAPQENGGFDITIDKCSFGDFRTLTPVAVTTITGGASGGTMTITDSILRSGGWGALDLKAGHASQGFGVWDVTISGSLLLSNFDTRSLHSSLTNFTENGGSFGVDRVLTIHRSGDRFGDVPGHIYNISNSDIVNATTILDRPTYAIDVYTTTDVQHTVTIIDTNIVSPAGHALEGPRHAGPGLPDGSSSNVGSYSTTFTNVYVTTGTARSALWGAAGTGDVSVDPDYSGSLEGGDSRYNNVSLLTASSTSGPIGSAANIMTLVPVEMSTFTLQ